MDNNSENFKLEYNTQRRNLKLPEYGRNVQKMVNYLKTIEDRDKRNEQARAVVKVMEILNPQVHLQENYLQKLWDHLYIIADFDLDVDSPFPAPDREQLTAAPSMIPIRKKPIKATHYGRNIESIIDLIAEQEEGDGKKELIRALAVYMRQQYLIWNKDSVTEETIFQDIEKLSDYRIKVPEDLHLSKTPSDMSFSRPGINPMKSKNGKKNMNQRKNMRK